MNKHATSPEKSHNYSLPVVRCNWVWHKPDDTDVKPGVAQPDVVCDPMCARCAPT